ncbi:MAG TPA: manganese efflux pump [Solirubrobacteraceae bacterium]|nr:manganese efflux pump [Solirubrobacteraceae bacterium]
MIASFSVLRFVALVIPLGLDTLGVSFALGVIGLPARRRLRVALLFAAFEAAMPLLGAALGAPLGGALGGAADLLAAAVLLALGTYMLASSMRASEPRGLLSLNSIGGAVGLGLSVSLDELAIGFSAGLLRLPLAALVIAVGGQAFLATQLGLRLGARVGEAGSEIAERLAGVGILALGVLIGAQRLSG